MGGDGACMHACTSSSMDAGNLKERLKELTNERMSGWTNESINE